MDTPKSLLIKVTILILIDGFLQSSKTTKFWYNILGGHNPYFNRWFSAIFKIVDEKIIGI